MRKGKEPAGRRELLGLLGQYRGLFFVAGLFSFAANLLMLSGPIYMMQVYERVLTYRATETLVALTMILGFLYAILALLDICRTRIMLRIAAGFRAEAAKRVFAASLAQEVQRGPAAPSDGIGDLTAVSRFLGSAGTLAMFDLPWTPVFFAAFFWFHPMLGWLAIGSAALLMALKSAGHLWSRGVDQAGKAASAAAMRFRSQAVGDAQTIWAMGAAAHVLQSWQDRSKESAVANLAVQEVDGGVRALSRALRLFLQFLMLGVGAWLTLAGELAAGAMLAASVMLGRALAPFEALSAHWDGMQQARESWANLVSLLQTVPPPPGSPPRIEKTANLIVRNLTLAPPGVRHAKLSNISFELEPGQALGVIGPSGAGKSVLARAILGIWPPVGGRVLLGGTPVARFSGVCAGAAIGYLPQAMHLLEGTIAENIARFDPLAEMEQVTAAARDAAAHECIQRLPDGYQTLANAGSLALSGGEMQRLGLARALYGNPQLMVLDAPNANLDTEGSQALNAAVQSLKARGGMAVIMTHRPSGIQECDMLLVLDQGCLRAFGPKADVLNDLVRNAEGITLAAARKGAA